MAKKGLPSSGIVYSTDPNFQPAREAQEVPTLAPGQQRLQIKLDTKHRAGKAVTVVRGFEGLPKDLEELGRKLKTHCGTGGSVKDGEVIVQGDNREKVLQWLLKNGFVLSKKL